MNKTPLHDDDTESLAPSYHTIDDAQQPPPYDSIPDRRGPLSSASSNPIRPTSLLRRVFTRHASSTDPPRHFHPIVEYCASSRDIDLDAALLIVESEDPPWLSQPCLDAALSNAITKQERCTRNGSRAKVVDGLLKAGAAVDRGPDDATPLTHAVKHRNNELIILTLIRHGADVDMGLQTVLDMLFGSGTKKRKFGVELELVRYAILLVGRGAKTDKNPLHALANKPYALTIRQERKCYFTEALIQAGADVNAVDEQGQTPLSIALRRPNIPVCKTLLEYGARVDNKAC